MIYFYFSCKILNICKEYKLDEGVLIKGEHSSLIKKKCLSLDFKVPEESQSELY